MTAGAAPRSEGFRLGGIRPTCHLTGCVRPAHALSVVFSLGLVGCPPDEEPPPKVCAPVDLSCTPPYDPTFANVFEKTLKPTCAKSGVSCHAVTGRQGGVAFEDADDAYRGLLEGKVSAGDPACSAVYVRVAATDPNVRMPPGRSIDPAEQCAIARWIANGAKR
jgi:cytochrome c